MPDKRSRLRAWVGMNEMARAGDLGKSLAAEALGVLFINYFGCMSCLNIEKPSDTPSFVLIALTFGFVVMVAVQALGHVSGANLNPAITCGLLVTGKITIIRGLLYIIAQCVGAIIGTALLKVFTPDGAEGTLGTTALHSTVSIQQGLGVEFMLGFVLVLVVFGVIDPNKPESKIPAALAIGLTVALGHMSSIDYTGSSMNPARSLGSAVIANSWANHWIYWLGPCLGRILAAIFYTTLLAAPSQGEYSPVAREQASELKGLDSKRGDKQTA
uniref:Putative aquaporin major intrinsic protein family n=1 Tax=Panstrongylus lignarius TaxID=156445 RepID=A0A224XHR6_9HEMI